MSSKDASTEALSAPAYFTVTSTIGLLSPIVVVASVPVFLEYLVTLTRMSLAMSTATVVPTELSLATVDVTIFPSPSDYSVQLGTLPVSVLFLVVGFLFPVDAF